MDKVIAALEQVRPEERPQGLFSKAGKIELYNDLLQKFFDTKVITHEQYTRLRIHEA